MKTKRLFAAVLCAALLITGCNSSETGQGDSSYNSSNYTESSSFSESTSSSSSSSFTSSSFSSSSSSSSTTSSTKPKPVVPKANFDTDSVSVNQEGQYMTVPFKTNVSFDPKTNYYLRIYFSDTGNSVGELRWDDAFDTSSDSLNLKLHKGMNYYTIQFYSDEAEGEYSNTVSYNFATAVPVVLDFAATDLLGKTVDDAAEMFGHSPSDYTISQDDSDWNVKFQADPDIELYSLVGYTYGKIRCVGISSNKIRISSGCGSIDNIRIGMTESEFLAALTDVHPQNYGIRGLYMMSYFNIDFTVLLDENNRVYYVDVDNSNITF